MATTRRRYILYLLAIAACIYSLAPIYNLISISLMDPRQLVGGQLFPPTPSLGNYLRLFGYAVTGFSNGGTPFSESDQVKQGLINSLIVAFSVMSITLLACVPAGYALGRLRIRGRTAMVGLLLGSRTLPPVSVALPYFFYFSALHLRVRSRAW